MIICAMPAARSAKLAAITHGLSKAGVVWLKLIAILIYLMLAEYARFDVFDIQLEEAMAYNLWLA
jgi:hypothetical protein